jgi:MoxR-like ATPase
VIATQNPMHQVGTFPLPESQLDRFLMRINLGYPDAKAERELLRGPERRDMISHLQPAMTRDQLMELQKAVPQMQVSERCSTTCSSSSTTRATRRASRRASRPAPGSRSCAPRSRGR